MKTERKVAGVALVVIFALLAVGFVALVAKKAHAADGQTQWDKWNVAPYATSREEACRKAPAAIDGFTMPETVKERFKQLLGADCKGGIETWLTPLQQLDEMWSGGTKPHVMQKVAVGELPVLRSPDGRPYRKGAVAETARAFSWSVTYEGKVYTLLLPLVCFNWSWVTSPATTFAPVGQCPDVHTLKVNVWERTALKLPGVERTHAKEELGTQKFADAKTSRTHGKQFRDAYEAGELRRSETEHAFRVSLIMTPESQGGSTEITKEEVVGDIVVTGLRELQFTKAQLEEWNAIRVVAVNGDVVSPPRNNGTGLKELRFFNRLPDKDFGEWENNPVPDCIMNVHTIEE